ncbi:MULTISPECIES: helix-turn-helix transcriptional regulator [Cyanophyceae]|uniref:helix-turn-helix transcriptional regulator n=1 Tax=Cyanophyceae TaxID=3028117 RepID=UPI0016898EFC|nr:helix-turn-helix transcriptional regulator [Trichocoleus sp. FACHB-69]MBD1933454.1 helix-turn-helix transcriptional regulator [Trichocoleus sp. FACHB-69]
MTKEKEDQPKNQEYQLTLAELRKRAGLTQRKLADILDVTIKTVSAWERGEHEPCLTLTQTKKLVDGLQCSLNELIVATGKQLSTEEEEPRLTFTQTKRLTEILQCSLDDLVAAMEKHPPQKRN